MIVMPWARHNQANGKTHGTQTVPWLPVAIFRGEVSSPLSRKAADLKSEVCATYLPEKP
jgi:hypothetical protein